jgi:hypothetical protein
VVENIDAAPNGKVLLDAKAEDDAEEVLDFTETQNQNLNQAVNQFEEIEATESEEVNQVPVRIIKDTHDETEPIITGEENIEEKEEVVTPDALNEYRTRYGRMIRKPVRYRETKKAYAVI